MRAVLIALHVGGVALCALGLHALLTGRLGWAAMFAVAALAVAGVIAAIDAGDRA